MQTNRKEIKLYKAKSILDVTEKDSLYCLKADNETEFRIVVTDAFGNPVNLKDLTGATNIVSGDNTITITGTTTKDIRISTTLYNLINSALQAGDNISSLTNDSNFITLGDIPSFNPTDYDLTDFTNTNVDPFARLSDIVSGSGIQSVVAGTNITIDNTDPLNPIISSTFDPLDYDLNDFSNLSGDPFARQSDLNSGSTNLGYTPSPTEGIVTSDTGTDATIPLADVTNAGLLKPSKYSLLENITEAFTTALKTAYDSTVTWISTNGTNVISAYTWVTTNGSNLISHLTNTSNPHSTTASQVGAEPTISAGTISEYWRGDKSWQTFPSIPSVGTWGALNYPTWVSGTPFVKMSATGVFTLDNSIYADNSNVVHLTGDEIISGIKTFLLMVRVGAGSNFSEIGGIPHFWNTIAGTTFNFGGTPGNYQNNLNISNGTFSIAQQTADTIASFDSSKNIISLDTITYPSLTELSYGKGVTSAIQIQIDSKANTVSPTFTGTVVLPSTTSIGSVSSTEIGYLDGVTSSIQTQIDAVNVNVITLTTSISIDTNTVSGAYGQHGRHNKISNGANTINLTVQTSSNADFVASYEKIGTGTITFVAGSGATLTTLSGTAAMTGVSGSKACLSRNGNTYYLQITNY